MRPPAELVNFCLILGIPCLGFLGPGLAHAWGSGGMAALLIPQTAVGLRETLFEFVTGGFLAGLLHSLIFGYYGLSWNDMDWSMGLLDLLILTTLFLTGYQLCRRRPPAEERPSPPPPRRSSFLSPKEEAPPAVTMNDAAAPVVAQIAAADPQFNLEAFADQTRRLIADLHEAWNAQDLAPVREQLTPGMQEFLQNGLETLQQQGQISRLSELTFQRLEVTQAERNGAGELITLGVQGRMVDYLLESHTAKLLSGSLTYPKEFQEHWTFTRDPGRPTWRLAKIESL